MGIILTDSSHGHCLPPCSLSFIIKSNYLILLAFFTVRETFTVPGFRADCWVMDPCGGYHTSTHAEQQFLFYLNSPLLFQSLHCFNLCFIYMLVLFLCVLVPDLLFSASLLKCNFSFGHFLFSLESCCSVLPHFSFAAFFLLIVCFLFPPAMLSSSVLPSPLFSFAISLLCTHCPLPSFVWSFHYQSEFLFVCLCPLTPQTRSPTQCAGSFLYFC